MTSPDDAHHPDALLDALPDALPDALLDALHAARDDAVRRLAEFEEVVAGLADARTDADGDDEHDPEGSTVAWDRAAQASTVAAAREHLAEIDAALARVRGGWAGACAGCRAPIPVERLVARPSAERCVHCASARTRG